MTDVPMPATPSEPDGEPDFDAFLRESTEQAEQTALYEELVQAYMQHIILASKRYGVDLMPEQGIEYPLDDPELSDRMAFRDHALQTIVATLMVHEQAARKSDAGTVAEVEQQKKATMAAYLISGRISPGSPWYQLLDDLLPGTSLDLDNVDDSAYIIEAMVDYESDLALQPDRDAIFNDVGDFIEAYALKKELDLDTANRLGIAITDLFKFGGDNESVLMAGLDELCRSFAIKGKYLLELRTLAIRIFELNHRS